jgi:DNA primase
LKKYQSPDNGPLPLYNLKELLDHPTQPILIVEGEKTAEAAKVIFPELAVTTWHGGAGNLKAADLSPLKGREVVLWPDNDAIGHKAMEMMAQRCKEVGAKSIKMVGILQFGKDAPKLPEKWDLADALPQGITQEMVRTKVSEVGGVSLMKTELYAEYKAIMQFMDQKGYTKQLSRNFLAHLKFDPQAAIDTFNSLHRNKTDAAQRDTVEITPKVQRPLSPEQHVRQSLSFLRSEQLHLTYATALGRTDEIKAHQDRIHALKMDMIQNQTLMKTLTYLDEKMHAELKKFEKEQHAIAQQTMIKDRGFER